MDIMSYKVLVLATLNEPSHVKLPQVILFLSPFFSIDLVGRSLWSCFRPVLSTNFVLVSRESLTWRDLIRYFETGKWGLVAEVPCGRRVRT